jgi:hypothetical protein
VVVLGFPLWFVNEKVALRIIFFGLAVLIVTDGMFSVIVTRIFLKPLFRIMNGADDGVRQQSAGYKRMWQTAHMTLVGSTLAIGSSTVLYLNILLLIAWGPGSIFYSSPFLHVLCFGINLDSVLNAVGMLLASGTFRDLSIRAVMKSLRSRLSGPTQKSAAAVEAAATPSFQFNSRAYDEPSVRPAEL